MSGEPITTWREFRAHLRKRIDELDISRRTLDDIAGFYEGKTEKLLCEPPIRGVGPDTFFPLILSVGLGIAFVDVPQERIKSASRRVGAQVRNGLGHWRNAKALGIVMEVARNTGKMGGKMRFARMTPDQIRTHQSRAAKKRWQAHRRAKKEGSSVS